ncbi:MAG: hypothetical protein PHO37_09175 [Kiritimatiellae bacterium]|nr:hypothetical protein [Kiritimatiellia bacterium]
MDSLEMNNPPSLVGSDPSVIATLLVPLFKRLDLENIQWAVLRGWEELPHYTRHDVDFLIANKDIKRTIAIAGLVAHEEGWIEYGAFKFSNLRSHWYLLDGKDEVSYLQLDFFTAASLRGVLFLDSGPWFDKRKRNKAGIWHMTIGYAACCTLLKELIANGKIEGELRHRQVREAIKEDREDYTLALSQSLNNVELVKKIVACSEKEDWAEAAKLSPAIRRAVMRFKFRNLPGISMYIIDVLRMQFFPYLRLFIAFIGPDGCGKTTIADAIVKRFDHRPFAGLYRIRSDFGFFPRLRDIKKFVCKIVGKHIEFPPEPTPGTTHMGMKPPLSRPRSMFYVFYYGLGLCLGQVKLLLWRSFSGIILADRYYFDYYYMRGHMHCPKWYLNLIGCMVPKPDMVFVLERSAEEIYAQKPELSVEEIKRQQEAIRLCLNGKKYARIIDASEGVEATIAKVSREIELWLISKGRNYG